MHWKLGHWTMGHRMHRLYNEEGPAAISVPDILGAFPGYTAAFKMGRPTRNATCCGVCDTQAGRSVDSSACFFVPRPSRSENLA